MPVQLKFPKPGSIRKIGRTFAQVQWHLESIKSTIKEIDEQEFAKNRIIRNSVLLDLMWIGKLFQRVTGNPDDENTGDIDRYGLIKSFPEVSWFGVKKFANIVQYDCFQIVPSIVWNNLRLTIPAIDSMLVVIRESYPDVVREMEKETAAIQSVNRLAVIIAEHP